MNQINAGKFYKVKDAVDGKQTPGGYFYIHTATLEEIKFSAVAFPSLEYVETAGQFTMARAALEPLIDSEIEL